MSNSIYQPTPTESFSRWVLRWNIGPGMNDPQGTTHYSGWDGDVPDEWIPTLNWLCRRLRKLGWAGGLDQVKVKFGTLRFYATGLPSKKRILAERLIYQAMLRCSRVKLKHLKENSD